MRRCTKIDKYEVWPWVVIQFRIKIAQTSFLLKKSLKQVQLMNLKLDKDFIHVTKYDYKDLSAQPNTELRCCKFSLALLSCSLIERIYAQSSPSLFFHKINDGAIHWRLEWMCYYRNSCKYILIIGLRLVTCLSLVKTGVTLCWDKNVSGIS